MFHTALTLVQVVALTGVRRFFGLYGGAVCFSRCLHKLASLFSLQTFASSIAFLTYDHLVSRDKKELIGASGSVLALFAYVASFCAVRFAE